MNRRIPNMLAAVAAVALLMMGSTAAFAQSGPEYLVLNFDKLAPLNEDVDGHYEGWAIIDGMPVSTGNFNVNDMGEPVELGGGPVIEEFNAGQDITDATDIKITIEPPMDSDPAPSGLVIVGGPVDGNEADLVTAVPGLDMLTNMTTGAYFLATPSDNETMPDNNDMGIWYLTMPGPEAGFQNLPDIGPNWVYEGWVVDVSGGSPVPYSTGTFSDPAMADSDEAGCNGGGPPFPGQDFVEFQCGPVLDLDTGDFATVLTIEPVPDTSPAPFQLKPLAGMIPTDALGQNNPMNNQVADTFPTGWAMLFQGVAAEQANWSQVKGLYR
jgi:hypothetical protein